MRQRITVYKVCRPAALSFAHLVCAHSVLGIMSVLGTEWLLPFYHSQGWPACVYMYACSYMCGYISFMYYV